MKTKIVITFESIPDKNGVPTQHTEITGTASKAHIQSAIEFFLPKYLRRLEEYENGTLRVDELGEVLL